MDKFEDFETLEDSLDDLFSDTEAMEKSRKFFTAESDARKKAGVDGKEGLVELTCPNCGSKVISNFYMHGKSLHGGTGCAKCEIFLRV